MNISVITHNYQERQEDLHEKLKNLESELAIVKMDYEEDEEMLKAANERMKKLESEIKRLKVENGKLRGMKKEVKE